MCYSGVDKNDNIFRRVRIVANSTDKLRHVHSYARLPPCISMAPTELIYMKFDTRDLYEDVSRKC